MARTVTEKLISRSRNGDILRPLLEERLRNKVEVEDEVDVKFITGLVAMQAEREKLRGSEKMYSPSQLASCLRAVYMNRHYEGPRVKENRIEPNFYFMTGDWLHVKWQFVLHKMHREKVEGFKLIGCEIPVRSKRGDHGGTIDAVCEIYDDLCGVDFKGLNVRAFNQAVYGDVAINYKVQLTDYMILWNSDRTIKHPNLKYGLLMVENKGGPDPKHPIAMTELKLEIDEHRPEVRWRLEELRKHEREGSIPDPECTSVQTIQFQGCAFRKFCRKEVKEIQQRNAKDRNTDEFEINVPKRKRTTNSRRVSRR